MALPKELALDDSQIEAPVENPGPMKSTASGRNRRWMVFTPERVVTWDNFKLDRLS